VEGIVPVEPHISIASVRDSIPMDPLKEKESDHLAIGAPGQHKKAVIARVLAPMIMEEAYPRRPFATSHLRLLPYSLSNGAENAGKLLSWINIPP